MAVPGGTLGEEGHEDGDGCDGENRGHGDGGGEDLGILSYFFSLDHGKVSHGYRSHKAHGQGCGGVKVKSAHEVNDAHGDKEHAQRHVAPDPRIP